MVIEESNIKLKIAHRIYSRIILIAVDYAKVTPLVFLFTFILACILILITGTQLEIPFVKLVLYTLGIKEDTVDLNETHVSRLLFIWWFIIGTILNIFLGLIHIKVSRTKWFFLISIALIPLTVATAYKVQNVFVPVFMYVFAISSLGIYNVIALGSDRLREFINSHDK